MLIMKSYKPIMQTELRQINIGTWGWTTIDMTFNVRIERKKVNLDKLVEEAKKQVERQAMRMLNASVKKQNGSD